ncbi:MAG: Holliday junction resolvase RuvX [Syntrophobacterales bacterium]|nr:MAG: Holliday junction resolvase RuvX [Syntrophobacterales bacterium]
MRILGLDVGIKRIGIAISDELGWTAQGIKTLHRHNGERDVREIRDIVREYEVEKIVVGLPRNMNGSLGPQAEMALGFVQELSEILGVPIITWDERLSTVEATRLFIKADLSRKKRKGKVDMTAAILILQSYLDSLARKGNP